MILLRLIAFLLLALGSCSMRYDVPHKAVVPTVQNPSWWKNESRLVTTEVFSVVLPRSLRDVPVVKDDSPLWKFADENMTVTIETGPYAADYGDYLKSYPEYWEEQRSIDGELVKLVSFNYGDKSHTLLEPSKQYLVGVHFNTSDGVKTELTAQVHFRSDSDKQRAIDIIGSIRFNR